MSAELSARPSLVAAFSLEQSPSWLFEGEVFNIPVPDQQGNCAAGTQPVYRLYNKRTRWRAQPSLHDES
jgi:hypothetical protein